ncbi:cortical cell-delineating protein-like [Lolium rigidum]|uniref:cortical cell-delineating protein-like n=1 Tax=Lolium rigidum TaxID=89674 RepID=UPI001F5D9932|nr:cortical cell-delineating protein-like [Lolium rigidum]
MAPSKLVLFLAVNLALLATTAHACGPYCPSPTPPPTCSIDTLRLQVCANVLNLLKLNLPVPANEECCPLLSGLANLDASICLCTALKAEILGIKLNVPLAFTLLLNQCHKTCPDNFTCSS